MPNDLFPDTLETFTLSQLINEAERELSMRQSVYPRWVQSGKLKKKTAETRIAMQKTIVHILKAKKGE